MWLSYDVKQRRGDADCSDYLNRMTQTAIKEYTTAWTGDKPPHHRLVFQGLSRYFDINYLHFLASCESGWDHSTRCDDQWLDFLPIDLNTILYVNEMDIARALQQLGQNKESEAWNEKAEKRKETIQNLMWDADQGIYFDYNWKNHQLFDHPSLAGFYPLWAGLATEDQAKQLVQKWIPKFLYPGGLVTTLEQKEDRQWAFPNGWAPLQWIVDAGLERYGYAQAALDIRQRWCQNCETVFNQTQAMWEKYNVVHIGENVEPGVYGQVKGFGWSNAVYIDFARRTPV
jgi:alpha,alpha-trehalase